MSQGTAAPAPAPGPGAGPDPASTPIVRFRREYVPRRRKRLVIPRRDPARIDAEAIYFKADVAAFFGVSQQVVGRWESDGRRPSPIAGFPAGVKLGAKTCWRGHMLIAWLRRLLEDEREDIEDGARREATRSPRSRAMEDLARRRWAKHGAQQADAPPDRPDVGVRPAAE